MTERFIEWARAHKWEIKTSPEPVPLPGHIVKRYGIPEKWYAFISKFTVCEDADAFRWFLTPNDYQPREDGCQWNGYKWNEFELQSLEWCGDDPDIISFWDKHLPIVYSVDGECSYYAIDTESGKVVKGYEPEYEEADAVADNFEDFIEKIISGEIML